MASTTSSPMPPARPMVSASEPLTLLPTWLSASAAPAALRMPVRIAVRPAAESHPASVDSQEKPPNSSLWRSRRDAAPAARSPDSRGRARRRWWRHRSRRLCEWAPWLAESLAVGLDALLADLLGDRLLVGVDVLVEAHALLGDGALLDDGLLLVQHDLVLLLGDRRAVHRLADVGVGDRLALDADLLALHRDGLRDVLGHDVLAQPRAPGLPLGRADPQLLLGPRHRLIGRRAGGVMADCAAAGALAVGHVEIGRVVPGREAGVRRRLAVVEAVVAVQRGLLLPGQLTVGLGVGCVLQLILAVRQLHAVAGVRGLGQRCEADLGAEQARLDGGPPGLAGVTVEVDVGDRAELLAVAAVGLLAPPRLDVIDRWHAVSPTRLVI